MQQQNEKSPHILNASSNLLGICFIVLTSLKLLDKSETTIIDEVTIVAIIFFMASCVLSFLSMRNGRAAKNWNRRRIIFSLADLYCFLPPPCFFHSILSDSEG
jgi:hypothetical protein